MVAISSAVAAGSACGSSVVTFCSLAARSISSNMLKSLLLPAGPSGPRPTLMPSASIRTTGATPLASFMLLEGQCATPTPRAFRIAMSASFDPHAMRGHGAAVEDAQRIQASGGRHVALAPARRRFPSWFPQGESAAARCTVGQRAGGLQRLIGIGVERVRRHGRHDQRVVAEAREVPLGEFAARRRASWRRPPGSR